LAIEIATGAIKNIVVTLSRKADKIAVIKKKEKYKIQTLHFEISNNLTAIHSNNLV